MAEHGLAFHLRAGEQSLLFDTGQTALLMQNAHQLGVDLSRLQTVALSHGHSDHTGGLRAVWDAAPNAELYAHPAAFAPHLARDSDGSARNVGLSTENMEAIQRHAGVVHETFSTAEVADGIFVTGEIPRLTEFEDVGGPFVLDGTSLKPDPLLDDQALFFDTVEGVIVLLGCAHAGAVNTLRHIRQLTGDRPFHALIGGMHLVSAGPERMDRTVEALKDTGLRLFASGHCTGPAATARLWHELPRACTVCSVGSRFVFQR